MNIHNKALLITDNAKKLQLIKALKNIWNLLKTFYV